MGMTHREHIVRNIMITGVIIAGLLLWIRGYLQEAVIRVVQKLTISFLAAPVSALATLLSFQELEKVAPWLARLIERSPIVAALVQTTLPSSALLIFNAILPYLLEWLCYIQGFRSKSEISTSILKK
jgi:hypothetical protein